MMCWYEFKSDIYNQIIKDNFPRELIFSTFVKDGHPVVITKMRFSTNLLTLLQREMLSEAKISDELRYKWLNQLLSQFQKFKPINPRLDFLMIDTRSGELFFYFNSFIPKTI